MTAEHRNAALLRRIYSHQEPGVLDANMSSDFICHTPGESPISGRWIGRDGFATHVAQLRELCDDSFEHPPIGFFATDHWGMVPLSIRASRKGDTVQMAGCGVWRFDDTGRVAEHWELVADQTTWDAFWSR